MKKTSMIAACDEVGRGCLAGPVVAAAVVWPEDINHKDLSDSKKLSRKKIESMSLWIKEQAHDYAIGICSPSRIDRTNILQSSIEAMHRALSKLHILPDQLIIDGNRFTPYLDIPYTCIVSGDATNKSISAASIIAKDYRDRYMRLLDAWYPQYGWQKNVGYPTAQHKKALREFGPTPFHRTTFKGVASYQVSLFDS